MPIGPWPNFGACVAHMRDKGHYSEEVARKICGKLEQQMARKFDGWIEEKAWEENERIFEGYITEDLIDKQTERIPLDKAIMAMTTYLRTGKLMDGHSSEIRGEPLAWKVDRNRILCRFGVYSRMPGDDRFWERVKALSKKGGLSIGGEPVGGRKIICQGEKCWLEPKDVAFFEVSFVDNRPANVGAKVTSVNMFAKGESMEKNKEDFMEAAVQFHNVVNGLEKVDYYDYGECIPYAEARGDIKDPEAFCAWLRWYGKHGEKYRKPTGKFDISLMDEELDLIMESCGNCKKAVEGLVADGYSEDDARVMVKAWLASLVNVKPASPEDAGETMENETMKKEDMEQIADMVAKKLQKQAPEEGAPPPEGEGEAGSERNLAAELDEVKAQLAKLASAVESALGKVESETEAPVEAEAEEAAEVEEEVQPGGEGEEKKEPPVEKENEKKLEELEKENKTLRKELGKPAREPRGRVPKKPDEGANLGKGVGELVVKSINAGKSGIPKAEILLKGSEQLLE